MRIKGDCEYGDALKTSALYKCKLFFQKLQFVPQVEKSKLSKQMHCFYVKTFAFPSEWGLIYHKSIFTQEEGY